MLTLFVKRYGVSALAYSKILDMAAKVERTANDYAAQEILAKIIRDSGLSLRALSQKMDGLASHTRIADIINGEKGPMRLSEFMAICTACGKDPAQVARQVVDRAAEIESSEQVDEDDPQWIADHLDQFDIAAKYGDTEAEQQAYEDLP